MRLDIAHIPDGKQPSGRIPVHEALCGASLGISPDGPVPGAPACPDCARIASGAARGAQPNPRRALAS